MRRRAWAAAGAAVLIAAVGGGAAVLSGTDEASPATGEEGVASTAEVVEGELRSMVALNGVMTYRGRPDGSPFPAVNRAEGTYTRLPTVGDRVGCGDVLYRVDDAPVLLLCGTVPAYRDLATGDAGHDVHQLNRNLHDLGYAADPGDESFTWRTRQALERLQRDRGVEDATGELGLGEAVFLPQPIRIAEVDGEPGSIARKGAAVVRATSARLEVQVSLEPSQQGAIKRGDRARVTLPGNRTVQGRVDRVGRVAVAPDEDDDAVAHATIPASIRLDDPRRARGLDRAPVRVEVTTEGVARALSVPVTALVGRPGNGFAVEVVRAGGRREPVAVRLGLFDDAAGRVEVAGALRAGDDVVVPAS